MQSYVSRISNPARKVFENSLFPANHETARVKTALPLRRNCSKQHFRRIVQQSEAIRLSLDKQGHPIGCLAISFAGNRASYWMPCSPISREQGILLDALWYTDSTTSKYQWAIHKPGYHLFKQ